MEIIAQTTPETARALRSGQATPEAHRIADMLSQFGARAEPMFQRATEGEMLTFFSIRGAKPQDGGRIATRLRDLPGVTSAYVKPGAAPARLESKPITPGGFGPRRIAFR